MTRLAARLIVTVCLILSVGCTAFAASALTLGQAQTGSIGAAAQVNSYTFSANANDVAVFTLVITSGAMIPKFQLVDPNGKSVVSTYSGSPFSCSGTALTIKATQLTVTGTYTVNVQDCSGTNTGSYGLYGQRTDNAPGAAALIYGQVATGSIGTAAQANSYTFSANANDQIDFTIVATSGAMVPKITVYDPNGAPVQNGSTYGGSPFSCTGTDVELNTVTLAVTGTYSVLVSDCSGLDTGNYSIYSQLTDKPAGPTGLLIGQVQQGQISSTAGSNSYSFSGNDNDVMYFELATTTGALIPKIRVYDPNGTLVKNGSTYAGSPFSCSGSTAELDGGNTSTSTLTLSITGTYTVLVGDCADTNTGVYDMYSERLNSPPSPAPVLLAQTGAYVFAWPTLSLASTFTGNANDVMYFEMATTSGGLIPRMRLYQPNGQLVGSTAYSGQPFGCSGSTAEMNTATLPVTGTYTLLASDCQDTNTGNAVIYAQRTSNPTGASTMNWGQAQSAPVITAGQMNTYTLEGNSGDVVNFTMKVTSGGMVPKIHLYDPTGAPVKNGSTYAGSPFACNGTTATLSSITLALSGIYTVLAGDCSGADTGNYTLSTTCTGTCPSLGSAPSPVTTFLPAQGATGVSTSPSLSWGAASGATSYNVYLGTTTNPPLVGTTSSLSFSPGTLAPDTLYFWFVTAVNSSGSTQSATWYFTTGGSSGSCTFTLSPSSANLPAMGTSTVETCPNSSGQPNCGVAPETPVSFSVTPGAGCGAWTATSSNPEFLQITSGASGSGTGSVSYELLNNTHGSAQNYSITVASAAGSSTYSVTEAGSGDNEVYREVYALYEQLLGRDPDASGFGFWTGGGGAGLGQMADDFLTSPEAFNNDFAVMAVYQAATNAPPTFAQYNAAVTAIRAQTQTITGLFNSLAGAGYSAAALYQNLLNRAPSAAETTAANNAGLANWFETLIGYPASVAPVSAPNNEFQSTGSFITDHTNSLYVRLVYFVTVSRDPDQSGFTFWVGIANGGGPGLLFQGAAGYPTRFQILGPGTPNQGFIGSPEFQGLFSN